MTYDYELTLIQSAISENDIGDPVRFNTQTVILCGVKSIGRSEFYTAAAAGLRPEAIFVVHSYEYNGESELVFEGVRYKVVRTYASSFEETELTCEKFLGGG